MSWSPAVRKRVRALVPYGACNVVAWAERHGYPVPPRIRELADSVAAPRAAAQTDASEGGR